MKEEFEKLVAAGRINRQHVDQLTSLAQCGYCLHRSWGFGKITTIDTVFSRFTIDFINKPNHSMDLAFAADSLKPIPKTHILARKTYQLGELKNMAAADHLSLLRLVLESYDGKATVDQIQSMLVPEIIAEDWRKWWEAARREMKKDGHFQIPLKKSELIIYNLQEVSLQDRLMGEFRSAKGLKARLIQTSELLKSYPDLNDGPSAIKEVVALLNLEISSHQRTLPALALEAIFVRNELHESAKLPQQPGSLSAKDIWMLNPPVGKVLEEMPSTKHKQAMQSFRAAHESDWVEILLDSINSVSAKVCGEFAQLLIQEGKLDLLKTVLVKLISQHQATSNLLLWLAKERTDEFADILGPEVFRAMLTAMELDQFNEKKSNRLRDYVLDDQELIVDLIGSADIEIIKDLTRNLQLSPSFDDMDKRSLLGRIVKHFPAIQSLISGEQHIRQDAALIVSWESLERRKIEYTELVHKKIPANSREIAIARSYGDLRENHEYKAAKEMQKFLMKQKSELENQLSRSRGTDFLNVQTDTVNVGTKIKVTDLQTQHLETYNILGAWDFEIEKNIISYLSPMAQALLNHKVGDSVEYVMDGNQKAYRIESIEAYRTA